MVISAEDLARSYPVAVGVATAEQWPTEPGEGVDCAALMCEAARAAVVDTGSESIASMVDLVREGANMLITRTFSKIFGMAGLRVGYGMGHPDIVSVVKDNVMAWPNGVGLYAAYHSYLDEDFIAFSRDKILQGRQMVNATFRRHGIESLPSQTNFVYADIQRDADVFKAKMAARNIKIRGIYEGYDTYSRVSMGRIEELEIFDRVFGEVYTG